MNREDILKDIFNNTTNGFGNNRRYIAKSYSGSTSWGVYDRIEKRFLSKDLNELTENNYKEPIN